MQKRERIFKVITKYITLFYIVFGLIMAVYNFFFSTPYYVILSLASICFAFLPALFFKVTGMNPVYSLAFVSDIFCFLAFTIGMVFAGHNEIPYYDKVVHTISGAFFGFIGLIIYYLLKKERKIEQTDYGQASIFSVSFTMLIAVVWEVYEYAINFILHNDPQHVATTGVNDTMQDMIVCLIGGLLFSCSMYFFYKRDKRSLLMGVFETFFNKNMK